jgi:phosphodiesterase/alkaline phosphatase D-like protein
MNRLLAKLAMATTASVLLYSTPLASQLTPSSRKAARVQITQGPELEMTKYDMAIITWTSNNPGGDPEHFGVVHYGTDPNKLDATAKSHIRLNPGHSETVFRVRINDLKPQTTYYYTVDSMEANGNNDGVKSPIKRFTTR